ncbi:MAG TPA: metallophosphoesterase, partial [Candidatus Saccharimonadales bacterium]|nr:metallophosphoesterase [Candidatus Saccharimonadales bacterium]
MTAFFISDIHLHPNRPETVEAFLRVLEKIGQQTDTATAEKLSLYLLGDIFDAWIGDDDPEPLWQKIKEKLKQLTEEGFPLFWIAGNRDFLVGKQFF